MLSVFSMNLLCKFFFVCFGLQRLLCIKALTSSNPNIILKLTGITRTTMAITTISRTSTAKATAQVTATTTEKTFNGLIYNTTIKIIKKNIKYYKGKEWRSFRKTCNYLSQSTYIIDSFIIFYFK